MIWTGLSWDIEINVVELRLSSGDCIIDVFPGMCLLCWLLIILRIFKRNLLLFFESSERCDEIIALSLTNLTNGITWRELYSGRWHRHVSNFWCSPKMCFLHLCLILKFELWHLYLKIQVAKLLCFSRSHSLVGVCVHFRWCIWLSSFFWFFGGSRALAEFLLGDLVEWLVDFFRSGVSPDLNTGHFIVNAIWMISVVSVFTCIYWYFNVIFLKVIKEICTISSL